MARWEVRVGNALTRLAEMPDESVQCCVTSPPYFGLRDYGTGEWEGGEDDCDHVEGMVRGDTQRETPGGRGGSFRGGTRQFADECGKCGGRRVDRQIGLERSPDEFVARLVEVFREVRRVLRADGTFWLNIGDSYANDMKWGGSSGGLKGKDLIGIPWMLAFALRADGWYLRSDVIWAKPNPMPESVTDRPTSAHEHVFLFAKGQWKARVVELADLRGERCHLGDHVGPKHADVWAHEFGVRLATAILDRAQREDQFGLPPLDSQVWQQSPGSRDGVAVGGLPVEHRAAVFSARLLSANAPAKEFLCELDRLGVALTEDNHLLISGCPARPFPLPPGINRYGKTAIAIHNSGEIGEIDFTLHTLKFSRPVGCSYFYDADAIREANSENTTPRPNRCEASAVDVGVYPGTGPTSIRFNGYAELTGRNKRNVWEVATQPYADAHFATFPPKLIEPCILAGSSPKACGECGTPWERMTGSVEVKPDLSQRTTAHYDTAERYGAGNGGNSGFDRLAAKMRAGVGRGTTGWQPSCSCHRRHCVSCTNPENGRPDSRCCDCTGAEPIYETLPGAKPCVILDPFAGAGTTGMVALRHDRSFIGIELKPAYAELARERIRQDAPLLNTASEVVA